MKRTYIYQDGELVEKPSSVRRNSHYVIPDIQPYRSMADGKMITSRSEHRNHLKRHGCIEIGNEINVAKPQKEDRTAVRRMLQDQLFNVTDSDCNRVLNKLRQQFPHRR